MSMTGGSAGDGSGGGFHTGSLNPGTGGNRDTYAPQKEAMWAQAEYARGDPDTVVRRRPLLRRVYLAARRLIQGY